MDNVLEQGVFIIAEMANAHEGNVTAAKAIVEAAANAKADAVKFQVFSPDELATPTYEDYELYGKLQMPKQAWQELVGHARALGLKVFSDVFGLPSAELMHSLGVDGFKIHAADVSNYALLRYVGASGKTVLLSVGGSVWTETADALLALKEAGALSVALMYGFQGYPNLLVDSYLRRIELLAEKFKLPIGFASHLGADDPEATMLPVWAVTAGASIIEEHLTLDRSRKGLDYFSSLEPGEFAEMVRRIRQVEPALGRRSLVLSPKEVEYRLSHKKWPVVTRDVKAGEAMTDRNVALKRAPDPPSGRALNLDMVIGHRAARDIPAYTPIQTKDLKMKVAATLACRAESTRLYGKPMQLVGGRPIMELLIEQLRQVKSIDEIVLAISEGPSRLIFIDYAEKHRLPYVVGPEKDVLKRLIMAGEKVGADIAVRTTTENPYTYWQNLDELIRLHVENNADLTVTEGLPLGTLIEVISMDALRRSHKHGEDRHRSELCSLFIAENPDIFTIQKVEGPKKLQRPEFRLTVDTPYDLILVRTLWDALHKEGRLITLEEIVDYLDAHPDLAKINLGEKTLKLWK